MMVRQRIESIHLKGNLLDDPYERRYVGKSNFHS